MGVRPSRCLVVEPRTEHVGFSSALPGDTLYPTGEKGRSVAYVGLAVLAAPVTVDCRDGELAALPESFWGLRGAKPSGSGAASPPRWLVVLGFRPNESGGLPERLCGSAALAAIALWPYEPAVLLVCVGGFAALTALDPRSDEVAASPEDFGVYAALTACNLRGGHADVAKTGQVGITPVLTAAGQGHCGIGGALLAARTGSEGAGQGGRSPVFMAAYPDHCGIFDALFATRADVDRAMQRGATPVSLAAGRGHCHVAHVPMAARADVGRAARGGATPGSLAAC